MANKFDGNHVYIVAEIGINHNGDLNRAKKLIAVASAVGADAVKFQKRTVEVVYTKEELNRPRDNPFGSTNGDLKFGLEFGKAEYDEIDSFCRELSIDWFASPWDLASVDFLCQYKIPYLKIGSACITDAHLLQACCRERPLLVSTAMCDSATVHRAVKRILDWNGTIACLYHCVGTYPTKIEHLNLQCIKTMQDSFPYLRIGYSGHETGVSTSVMAVALGAKSIERHLTLSRSDWGSDQAASLDIEGFRRLVIEIRRWEKARGDGRKVILNDELPIIEKLRRNDTI